MGITLIVPLSLPAFKKTELLPTPKKTLAFHLSNPKETIYFMPSLITFFDIGQLFGIVLIDCSLYRNTDQFDYSKFRTINTSDTQSSSHQCELKISEITNPTEGQSLSLRCPT